ncbi:MAG: DUF3516 domain-containing protein, partial [Thermoanaerobaculia bacterium]|nr:DUF3516 domain-containing protein [Thermoanaerobaculia bacterium]
VPLEFDYRETSLHETVEDLLEKRRAPVYIVSFTQRECAELAQGFTSMSLATREERERVWEELADFRFDTPYGKDVRRFLRFALGVHHAGLLPKYRLLVEQLAQEGLLKVIFGTDTLGVGVNMPVRTVLFNKLAKYDGQEVGILTVRDFQQIAGRAGRKGYDDQGTVVVQAPEHIIEKRKAEAKGKEHKGGAKKGEVVWTEETFDKLRSSNPESMESRFSVTPTMILDTVQHDADVDDPSRRNFHSLRELISRTHDDDRTRERHLRDAARLVRSLSRTGILGMEKDTKTDYLWVVVDEELQAEFSLHQTLSPWLVDAIEELDPEAEGYALSVLSRVEAVLEDPRVILLRQKDKRRDDLFHRLKAEGVPYEKRMEKLDQVTHPKPEAEEIYESFNEFRGRHAWVGGRTVSPKGIGREIFEDYLSFGDFVRRYGLARREGSLLRYLSQLYKTMIQSVPDRAKTEEVHDVIGFFRTMLEHTDTSLLEEWESLIHPEVRQGDEEERTQAKEGLRSYELFHDPKAFHARIRAELHRLVRALAQESWEEAVSSVRQDDSRYRWSQERFQEALEPFFEEYEEVRFDAEARRSHHTVIEKREPRVWEISQTLLDPEGDGFWSLEGGVDLSEGRSLEGPLLTLREIRG